MSKDNSHGTFEKDYSIENHAENLDYLSTSRTFNANVRTNGIFAGISLLLAKGGHPLEAILILLMKLFITLKLIQVQR